MLTISLLLQLFYTFFKIGLFGFGGGYAMLSMIQFEVVEAHQWLTVQEFTDIVAISQTTPGPIAINSATYIGYTAAGGNVIGSLVATFAVCLPSVIIMMLISRFFMIFRNNKYVSAAFAGMKPAAIGLIAAAALLLMTSLNFGTPAHEVVDYRCVIIAIAAFIASYFFKTGIITIIVISAVLGFLFL